MEIYRLDHRSVVTEIFDEFESCIWTERYIEAGDFKLVLPATEYNIGHMALGTKLQNNKSQEIMIVESREIADGSLTVSGRSLETILNNGGFPILIPGGSITLTGTPGGIIRRLTLYTIEHTATVDNGSGTKLQLGPQDDSGARVTETFSYASLYSQILSIAQKYGVGLSMYTGPIDGITANIFLKTYRGVDRTHNQNERERVLLSPHLDNFQGIKELRSISNSLNEVLVYPPEELRADFNIAFPGQNFVRCYAGPAPGDDFNNDKVAWTVNRKSIVAEDVTAKMVGARGDKQPTLAKLLRMAGERELAKHKRTHTIDGEVIPNEDLVYRRDYQLGDFVSVEGDWRTGGVVGMVMEYINSSDASGERSYPAVVTTQLPPHSDASQGTTFSGIDN